MWWQTKKQTRKDHVKSKNGFYAYTWVKLLFFFSLTKFHFSLEMKHLIRKNVHSYEPNILTNWYVEAKYRYIGENREKTMTTFVLWHSVRVWIFFYFLFLLLFYIWNVLCLCTRVHVCMCLFALIRIKDNPLLRLANKLMPERIHFRAKHTKRKEIWTTKSIRRKTTPKKTTSPSEKKNRQIQRNAKKKITL